LRLVRGAAQRRQPVLRRMRRKALNPFSFFHYMQQLKRRKFHIHCLKNIDQNRKMIAPP
jgi:hypothetical protein